jgi:hypothetical protein
MHPTVAIDRERRPAWGPLPRSVGEDRGSPLDADRLVIPLAPGIAARTTWSLPGEDVDV